MGRSFELSHPLACDVMPGTLTRTDLEAGMPYYRAYDALKEYAMPWRSSSITYIPDTKSCNA